MKTITEPQRLKDLIKLLESIKQLQTQLLNLIRDKLSAMRRSDTAEMQKLAEREQELVKHVQEREGLRKQLMDMIGEEIGLSSRSVRMLCITQLCDYIPQASREVLLMAAQSLREVVLKVAQANRVVSVTAREVVQHLAWVFSSVKPKSDRSPDYTGSGAPVVCAQARLFDTVG